MTQNEELKARREEVAELRRALLDVTLWLVRHRDSGTRTVDETVAWLRNHRL